MAKKITTGELKNGKIQFYVGGKVATIEQAKSYIKAFPNLVDKDKLKTPDLKRYLGAVKGGKARSEKYLRDDTGKMISKAMQDKFLKDFSKAKEKGIDIEQLLKDTNSKDYEDLFKKLPKLKKSLNNIFSETGVLQWYTINNSYNKVESYSGTNIYINDEILDKLNAIYFIENAWGLGKSYFDAMDASVKFHYKGMDNLYLEIPIEDNFENENYKDEGWKISFKGMEFYVSTLKDNKITEPKKSTKNVRKNKKSANKAKL